MSIKEYYKCNAEEIYDDVTASITEKKIISIQGIDLYVLPHVYPSDKFRTTNFVLNNIKPLLPNRTICDMGCGIGIVGQFALHHGAIKAVQVDINPYAAENAKINKQLHGYTDSQLQIFLSDCFDKVPPQKFDLIVFNMPYHSDEHEIKDPLEHAFHDPLFRSLNKFLKDLPKYSHSKSIATIAFSNKGDIAQLEAIFDSFKLDWELWRIINADKEYDNRIYLIKNICQTNSKN